MAKSKSTMGRQKIKIEPIQNEEARQVCFSKRRPSLFKKASEISTLCGAKVAVVVFSPGSNCYSFGHPSVNSVTNRFLAVSTTDDHAIGGGSHGTDGVVDTVNEMNQQLVDLQQLMRDEKQRKEKVQAAMERESGGHVMQWVTDVKALGLDELEEFYKALIALQGRVNGKAYQVLQEAKQTKKPLPQSHMYTASASPFLFGGKSVTPLSSTLPISTYPLHEGHDGNSMFNGFQSVGGYGNFFNGQFGG